MNGLAQRTSPDAGLLAPLPCGDGIQFVSLEKAERQGLCQTNHLPLTLKILYECALRNTQDPAALKLSGLANRPRQ
jgi:hypothetical protein